MRNFEQRGTAKQPEYGQSILPYNVPRINQGVIAMDKPIKKARCESIILSDEQIVKLCRSIKIGVYKQLCADGMITNSQLIQLLKETGY